MYFITARFRASRSRGIVGKPGVVFYHIGYRAEGDCAFCRCVNSDIFGHDTGVLNTRRELILKELRLLYCVIERRSESTVPFTIDDVVADFRRALAGDDSMAGVIARAATDFPLRSDIVSVGREFKDCFRYVFNSQGGNSGNFRDYVFNLVQSLKNEHRTSQARNLISMHSSINDFTNTDDLKFSKIGVKFVRDYAEWLKQRGIIESTQSFYLRMLRSVLNKADKDGLIAVSPEWFKDVNTRIYYSSSGVVDRNLSRQSLLKIENVNLSANAPLALVRDLFLFGFYCGGMELVDIANLTIDNVRNNCLIYRRRRKGQEKIVVLGEHALNIVNRYKRVDNHFLFPIDDIFGNVMFGTMRNYVSRCMKTLGVIIGCPNLTFSMNIETYKSLKADTNISELLMAHNVVV